MDDRLFTGMVIGDVLAIRTARPNLPEDAQAICCLILWQHAGSGTWVILPRENPLDRQSLDRRNLIKVLIESF